VRIKEQRYTNEASYARKVWSTQQTRASDAIELCMRRYTASHSRTCCQGGQTSSYGGTLRRRQLLSTSGLLIFLQLCIMLRDNVFHYRLITQELILN